MSEWKPMESAPKDGSWIVIWDPEAPSWWFGNYAEMQWMYDSDDDYHYWWTGSCDRQTDTQMRHCFWTPLPASHPLYGKTDEPQPVPTDPLADSR